MTAAQTAGAVWRRPYRRAWVQPLFWVFVPFGGLWVAFCVLALVLGVARGDAAAGAFFAVATAWGVLWTAYVARLARAGIYTSDFGVQVRNVARTHTVGWREVAGFSLTQDPKAVVLRWQGVGVKLSSGDAIKSTYPTSVSTWVRAGGDTPEQAIAALEMAMESHR